MGDLYDIGFDKPEAHVIAKDGRLYYAFYANRWDGAVELRGLGNSRYTLTNYWTGSTIGTASPKDNRLAVSFERFLLIEAAPVQAT
jgi:alpha-galactosidase